MTANYAQERIGTCRAATGLSGRAAHR